MKITFILAFLSLTLVQNYCSNITTHDHIIAYTLTNPYHHPVRIFKLHTPLDIIADHIKVNLNGEEIPYTWIFYSRIIGPEDYLTLNPGQSITKYFDVANYYDLTRPGTYEVTAMGNNLMGDSRITVPSHLGPIGERDEGTYPTHKSAWDLHYFRRNTVDVRAAWSNTIYITIESDNIPLHPEEYFNRRHNSQEKVIEEEFKREDITLFEL